MPRLALRALLVAAPLCLAVPQARAYEIQMAPSGAPVRWFEDEVVFRLELDGRDADLKRHAAERAAESALATWSDAGGPLLIGVVDDDGRGHDDEDDDGPVIRFATDRDDPDVHSDSLARTRLSFDPQSGRAQRVTITVNVFDYRWSVGVPCDDAYDLEATLAHEIGHALGFRHSEDPEATMYTQPRPCERDRRDLAADDLAGIAALYGEAPTSVNADDDTPAGGCSAGSRGGPGSALIVGFALLIAGARRTRRRKAIL
jgi:hypothetical protein